MDGEKNKGGHPFVSPGEPTEKLGPIYVGAELKAWVVSHADGTCRSQGSVVREALRDMRKKAARRERVALKEMGAEIV